MAIPVRSLLAMLLFTCAPNEVSAAFVSGLDSCKAHGCSSPPPYLVEVKHRVHRKHNDQLPQPSLCPHGEIADSDGNCLPVASRRNKTQQQALPPVEQCPEGQNLNPNTGNCFSCSHNDHFENGRCVPCQHGFHVSGESCVAD